MDFDVVVTVVMTEHIVCIGMKQTLSNDFDISFRNSFTI